MTNFDAYTIGALIEQRGKIKEAKADLNDQLKDWNELERQVDSALIKKMEEADTNKASSPNGHGSVTISEDTVAEVLDWDVFHDHIRQTGDFSLLQRRVAVTAFREALSLQGAIPGLAERKIKKVNYRSS